MRAVYLFHLFSLCALTSFFHFMMKLWQERARRYFQFGSLGQVSMDPKNRKLGIDLFVLPLL